jgi:hypothetical protein
MENPGCILKPQTSVCYMIKKVLSAVFRIRIRIGSVDQDSIRSGSGSVFGIRIRIQEGKNNAMTHKSRKKDISGFEMLKCSLLRAEGFFCNLDVPYGGLGIGKF